MTTTGAVCTTNGKNIELKRAFETLVTPVTQFKIGTGTTTPTDADTAMQTPITAWNGGSDLCNFSGTPVYDLVNSKVTVQGYIGATQANGTAITEWGCFNTDATPVMFSHDVTAAVTKTNAVQVIVTWVFQLTD